MLEYIPYILALVSGLLTFFLGRLSKKYGWNKEFPIQAQNVLVGIITCGIAMVIVHITGEDISFKEIASNIMGMVSGCGGATLIYDNIKPFLEARNLTKGE